MPPPHLWEVYLLQLPEAPGGPVACHCIIAVCLHPPTASSSLLLVLGSGIHWRIQCDYIWWWYSHEVVFNSLRSHRLSLSKFDSLQPHGL